ncbi:MAG: RDD family protein [Micrococcales bacterium]|nr:RDD family protein [Micrococcales bacterium]
MSSTGIVTGEGVLLESEPASAFTRMAGGFLDYLVYAAGLFAATMALGFVDYGLALSENAGAALAVALLVIMLVVVPITVETLSRGRSLGRLALGLRIVRDDGGAITVRHAMIRGLVAVLEIWMFLGVPAVIASMVHPKGKRLGDMLAGTYAARVRGGPRDQVVVVMPPRLALWASHADVARLPDSLALSVRQFLGRASKLHPQSRTRLGTELTAQVQRHVHPLPPAGTHPEEFLLAVLAERRQREGLSEQRRVVRTRTESDVLAHLPYGVPDVDH